MIGFVRLLLCLVVLFAPLSAGAAERITVFAAASLKDVMDRAVSEFEAHNEIEVVISLAASSVLARQIEAGAPADLFISADRLWMDWLGEREAVAAESVRVLAGNELVIATGNNVAGENVEDLLSDRFAMGDPSHVPAGRYAKAALSSLGVWESVKARAVFGENVRVALELARRGEVGAAIVYRSDVQVASGLTGAYPFPGDSHPPIVYPAALLPDAQPNAHAFLEFLSSASGQDIFAEYGFTPPPGQRS